MSKELSIEGTLIQIVKAESGTSKSSGKEWTKQDFIVETNDQFPRKICCTLFGDKVSLLNGITEGSDIDVSFNLESREFNGKWYHNINAWKIGVINTKSNDQSKHTEPETKLPPTEYADADNGDEDDSGLPF